MTGDPKAYVPKGINFPVPGVYQISQGSLPSMPSGVGNQEGFSIASPGSTIVQATLDNLAKIGVEVGDQLTVLGLEENENGTYSAYFQRVIVGLDATWDDTHDPDGALGDVTFRSTGLIFNDTKVACAAMILSRGTSSATAKRSTAFMTMNPDYAGLMSPEAYDAAIDSYIEGISYNSLNSDWYLNQGSTQAFNGQVYSQQLTLAQSEGVDEFTGTFLLGRQIEGSNMRNVIFTSDGTANGTAYALINGEWTTAAAYTAARVAAAMGSVGIAYRQYSAAIAAQLSGNA
jgi:hypothetical protein